MNRPAHPFCIKNKTRCSSHVHAVMNYNPRDVIHGLFVCLSVCVGDNHTPDRRAGEFSVGAGDAEEAYVPVHCQSMRLI